MGVILVSLFGLMLWSKNSGWSWWNKAVRKLSLMMLLSAISHQYLLFWLMAVMASFASLFRRNDGHSSCRFVDHSIA